MNDERVGTWSLPAGGPQQFTYAESWLQSNQFRPLSLSLPVGVGASTLRGEAVENWFDNLLPDSDAIRRRAQIRFQATSTSAFDLLAAVGRDCAGAVQLVPPDQEPSGTDRIEARPLSEQEIGQRLRAVTAAPAPGSLGPAAYGKALPVIGEAAHPEHQHVVVRNSEALAQGGIPDQLADRRRGQESSAR
jgi:serine/threonine-protein kinase HipA